MWIAFNSINGAQLILELIFLFLLLVFLCVLCLLRAYYVIWSKVIT